MLSMDTCPICSGITLRHIGGHRVYWYCPHCHQEVPDLRQSSPTCKIERARVRKTF